MATKSRQQLAREGVYRVVERIVEGRARRVPPYTELDAALDELVAAAKPAAKKRPAAARARAR